MPKRVTREKIYTKRRRWLDGWTMFKRTYGRWSLKGGEGKPKIETCGGEYHRRPRLTKGRRARRCGVCCLTFLRGLG